MNVLITIFLTSALVILLVPKPFRWTLKRLFLLFLIAALTMAIGVVFARTAETAVTITALKEKNESAEGTEIWLQKVIVDGEEYAPDELFSGDWAKEDGWLKWRAYDKDADSKRKLTGSIPRGSEIQLVFDACKWRGLAELETERGSYTIDTFAPTDKPKTQIKIFDFSTPPQIHKVSGKVVLQTVIAGLTALAICSMAIKAAIRKRKGMPLVPAESKGLEKREIWLDVLKIVSAFFIVQIHTVGGGYQSSFGSDGWWTVHFLNVIPRFAVPVFMMISGVLLLGREIPIGKAAKKAGKAVVLLVGWNLVYLLLNRLLRDNNADVWKEILAIPVKRQFSGHLWYIYFLVWMYLFNPVLSSLYRALSVRERCFFVLITLLIPGALDLYNSWYSFGGASPIQSWQLYMVPSYAGLMVLGRLLYDEAGKIRFKWLLGMFCTVVGFSGAYFLTAAYCKTRGASSDLFMSENRLFIVIFAMGVFLLAAALSGWLNGMSGGGKRVIVFISKRSLGIYLFHVIPIWTMSKIPIFDELLSSSHSAVYTLLKCGVYFLISIYCVAAMSEIPVLKKAVM